MEKFGVSTSLYVAILMLGVVSRVVARTCGAQEGLPCRVWRFLGDRSTTMFEHGFSAHFWHIFRTLRLVVGPCLTMDQRVLLRVHTKQKLGALNSEGLGTMIVPFPGIDY